jgi:serine/threonine protein kinase
MNYPLLSEYIEAIKAAEENFEELRNLRLVLDEDGEPVMSSGNFAVVFKMKNEQTGKLHAVKCFLKEQEGRADAYRMIAEELEYVNSTFLTPIKYLDKELFVDSKNSDKTEFPVLLMDWVEGITLDKYLREHIDDQYELSLLAYQFSRLAMWLMPQPFAHGDLKPDNILVKDDGTLVLVDYDGMYVPAMKGQKARELGSPDFRHPSRTENDFDEHIDDFSLASIMLSLKAISLQPALLEEYGASDRLLFSEKDYRNLSESKVMDALKPLMQDAELASLYSLYILALSQKNLSQVSFRLFNLKRPDKLQYEEENLSTEVTEDDLENAWTDEYGVKYSADKKRLLEMPRKIDKYNVLFGTKVICDSSLPDRMGGTNSLISINLPNGLLIIGRGAFKKSQIWQITIPESVLEIRPYAFGWCCFLKGITIPRGLKKIGECTFISCTGLTSIAIPLNVAEIEHSSHGVFEYCDRLSSIVVDKKNKFFDSRDNCNAIIETKSNKLIAGCKNSIIPNSVSIIGENAFSLCRCLGKITIPEGVVEIGSRAFYFCDSLTSIEIPDGVMSIGNRAFNGCTKLVSVKIPNSVRSIGEGAFGGCKSLETVRIPDDIDNIESGVFAGCASLKSIILPSTIKTIKDYAFSGCKSLTSINIPEGVNYIGIQAFFGCASLCSISIPGSISYWGCENNEIGVGVATAFVNCKSLKSIIIPKGTIKKYEKELWLCQNILVEQDEEEEICLAYCSEDSQACEDKEYALWQPHSKILKKNGKLGVVIDDGTTKKQIIPFIYDTWFDYDGYETDIRENFFDNYQDYIGYFAIKNSDGTFTMHGYDKDGTLTTSFTCEKFNPDSYSLHGKYILRYPKDEVEYDDIRRMRMYCDTYLDTRYLAFRKGNKWSLKSDDLKTTYIDFLDCDGFGSMYWTPKGYYVEIKNGEMSQICLCKKNANPLMLSDKFDYVSLRYFGTSQNNIDSVCFEIRKGDKLAVCSNDLQNISPFIFDSVGSMINNNEVKVTRLINGNKYEFIYQIVNSNGWIYNGTRPFSPEEIAAVARAEVVPSQFGNSVCFFMNGGGQTYIPLLNYSSLTIGDSVDLKTAKLVTLCREGDDDIYRVIEK